MHKLSKVLKENILFLMIFLFFAGYYVYRIFAITPWYDELYTYIYFIDKGISYSATHWPTPNNHIFFSITSSLLRIFGIYIGLRGVSWLAAVGTLLLLYSVLKRLFSKGFATFGIMVYGMFFETNAYAVQGRGYSLATFCLMLALYCGLEISYGKAHKRFYIFYALALYMGLYTLMSSLYWVLSVCLCFGILLLLLKKGRELLWLVISSGVAAVFTVCSYSILWFHMGAQQIQAEFGLPGSELSLILEYPRTCLLRGLEIMRSNPNLQSIDRSAFIHDFKYYFRGILSDFIGYQHIAMLPVFSILVMTVLIIGILRIVWCKKKGKNLDSWKELFSYILSSVGFLAIYIILLVQSVYPFARVFSFLGVYLVVLNSLLLDVFIKPVRILFQRNVNMIKYLILVNIPIFIWCIYSMTGVAHNQEYSGRDYYAFDAVKYVDWTEIKTYAVSDVYVRQQVVYHIQIGNGLAITADLETPDIIILYKTDNVVGWPFIISDEDIRHFALENRVLEYENELYCVYK